MSCDSDGSSIDDNAGFVDDTVFVGIFIGYGKGKIGFGRLEPFE